MTTTSIQRVSRVGRRAVARFSPDPERKVQKDLDIQEYTDPEHNSDDSAHPRAQTRPRDPTAFTTATGSGGAPSVANLWDDLRAVSSEVRPDWDLSTPGLREAWNAGDFSRFHGWSKRGDSKASLAGKKDA